MPSCVVKGCRNYDTKIKKEHGISYHRFPNDPVREEIWSRIIRKQRNDPYFKPRKNTRVCSAHFRNEDVDISASGLRRLKDSAVPRILIGVCQTKKKQLSKSAEGIKNIKIEEVDDELCNTEKNEPSTSDECNKKNKIEEVYVDGCNTEKNDHSTSVECIKNIKQEVIDVQENTEKIETSTSAENINKIKIKEIDVDISDLNSVFDTPREVKLKKRIVYLEKLHSVTAKKNKLLHKQNARLKKKNTELLKMIEELKKTKTITVEIKPNMPINE